MRQSSFSSLTAKARLDHFFNAILNDGRHPVDYLRTRYWYEEVKIRSGCENPTQIEKMIEPPDSDTLDSRTSFRNKWRRYQSVEVVPGPKTIALVERRFAGTARAFNHPVWWLLRQIYDGSANDSVLRRPIGKYVAELEGIPLHLRPQAPYSFSRQKGEGLSKRKSLDALAALLGYWVIALRDQEFFVAQGRVIILYIKRCFYGQEEKFHERKMLKELMEVLTVTVFEAESVCKTSDHRMYFWRHT